MKKFILAIFLLTASGVFAAGQKDTAGVLIINKIPDNGLLLKQGWKFHPGDDPAFAKPAYNDSDWQNIDPTVQAPDMPEAAQHGIGWLRIKLNVLPSSRQNAAIFIFQCPAVEIYLNGHLVGRRGTINNQLKTGLAYADVINPIQLPLSGGPEQVLAVRFAYPPFINHFNRYLFPTWLSLTFVNTPQIVHQLNYIWYVKSSWLIGASVLILLAIMHLVLFSYNIKNKGDLYFALYAACFGLAAILIATKVFYQQSDMEFQFCYSLLDNLLLTVSGLLGVRALQILFNFPSGIPYTFLIIVCIVLRIVWIFNTSLSAYTGWGVLLLPEGVMLWLSIKAIWYKKRGALVVAAGFLTGLIGLLTIVYVSYLPAISPMLWIMPVCMSILGPPLGMSIFLGREFALNSLLLAVKLREVEELSAQTIAQEQEKQEMLSSQNEQLEKQVTERTAELNQSLTNLKATQTQLIQSEKMASLGELTAGIAHEIQNPLNFVNNFSEVNQEMLDELDEELNKGDIAEAKAIAADIRQNEEKINHHGKRADAIVKGMLEHSRAGSGIKELTDINKLADEYLRLSYHGLRSKDKSFNAEMVTYFDEKLPQIMVIPQDIGRVMLNLFNNAFYAVNQKAKIVGEDYKPRVSVTTELYTPALAGRGVVVKVLDNGIGIPDAIKDKIMQPFFTTKPTGEGTGLGLSLTYDMVVKGHGGSIQVESIEGEGSEFIILLPFN